MDDTMTRELADAAKRCDTDQTKAVVLTGSGRFFCAGGDLKAMAAAPSPGRYVKGIADDLHRAISTFARMDAVLITAVNGVAAGAGFSLAVTGDLVLAAASAVGARRRTVGTPHRSPRRRRAGWSGGSTRWGIGFRSVEIQCRGEEVAAHLVQERPGGADGGRGSPDRRMCRLRRRPRRRRRLLGQASSRLRVAPGVASLQAAGLEAVLVGGEHRAGHLVGVLRCGAA
jgi:hypothetical protein